MKKCFSVFVMLLSVLFVQAQMVTPVKWKIQIKPLAGANQYEIIGTAVIDDGFKLYGVNLADGGPVKTSFNFEVTENCNKIGKAIEVTPSHKIMDKMFNMEISYFKEKATISHKIWISKKPAKVSGYIQWMSCNNEMCTPPQDEPFEFVIK